MIIQILKVLVLCAIAFMCIVIGEEIDVFNGGDSNEDR
jgi:hypothetical protein